MAESPKQMTDAGRRRPARARTAVPRPGDPRLIPGGRFDATPIGDERASIATTCRRTACLAATQRGSLANRARAARVDNA